MKYNAKETIVTVNGQEISMSDANQEINPVTPVLDHGFVRLVDHMGDDLAIVRNARVSYGAAWRSGEDEGSDTRLLKYLLTHGHNTPFEAVAVTFEVKAPIFVVRQWHRHRTQSYNEISARYKQLPKEYYVPDPAVIGVQAQGNKQCRDIDLGDVTEEHMQSLINMHQVIADHNAMSYAAYESLLDEGCPRELARSVLPVSMYTHMFATMNLHNLFGFLRERLHNHAQYEIRQYAHILLKLVSDVAPVATKIFVETLKEKEGYDL